MAEPYQKSFEDELDWNLLDQLHRVVLQTSTFCFRTKQIAITLDVAVIGILLKLSNNRPEDSIFVSGLIIPICFWFLDAIGYFYQVKLRAMMDAIRERLRRRNTDQLIAGRVIEEQRATSSHRLWRAFFNHSMWIYLFLAVGDLVLWVLFGKGFTP